MKYAGGTRLRHIFSLPPPYYISGANSRKALPASLSCHG